MAKGEGNDTEVKLGIGHIASSLLLAAGLLAGACSREHVGQDAGEIRFRVVDDWEEATKVAAPLATDSFGVTAYSGGTATEYFSGAQVDYVSSAWEFSGGKRYWPASGTLDFHAWMPVTKPSYIGTPTYSYANGPGFTCTALPLTSAGQATLPEYVYAYVSNCSKAANGVSGVELEFHRPFASVQIRFATDHEGITLNTITITGVMNNGDYTHAGGWSSQSHSDPENPNNLVLTYNCGLTSGEPPHVLGDYLVVPQNFEPQTIQVTYTPEDRSPVTLTGSIPSLTWEAGRRYVYTFLLKMNFTLTVTDLEAAAPSILTSVYVLDIPDGEYDDYTHLIVFN